MVADGDGDGVNAADVAAGVDRIVRAGRPPDDHFPRARFGLAGAMPAIDEAGVLTSADDPIRLGSADQLTLSPLGTATSGTVYIASRAGAQFAVRIAGVTGRARVLRYDPGRAHVACLLSDGDRRRRRRGLGRPASASPRRPCCARA